MRSEQTVDFNTTMSRVSACTITIRQTLQDLIDPYFLDQRADLLIAVQDLLNDATRLYSIASEIAWSESDEKAEQEQ
jgi:predicted component of type VI protein secretion system